MSILLSQVVETAGRLALAAVEQSAPSQPAAPAAEMPNVAAAVGEKSAAEAAPAPAAAPASESAATTATTGAKEPVWYQQMLNSGAMGYMIEGGIFMWPILILGILATGVIIERF